MVEILLFAVGTIALGLSAFFIAREFGSPEGKLRFGAQHSFSAPAIQQEIEPVPTRPYLKRFLKLLGFGCVGINLLIHNPESQVGVIALTLVSFLSGFLLGFLLLIGEIFVILRRLGHTSCVGLERSKLNTLFSRIQSTRWHYMKVAIALSAAIAYILFRF